MLHLNVNSDCAVHLPGKNRTKGTWYPSNQKYKEKQRMKSGGGFAPQVYLSWESELWVIKIHWNSTSEHQCSSSAKPVNSGMSDSFYTACTGHGVCQTDLSLHLQWSWSPAPRTSHASNISQRNPSLLLSKWREHNLLKCFREEKGTEFLNLKHPL